MSYRIEVGDCRDTLRKLAAEGVKVQTCVTSPPYFGLRSYLPDDHPEKALEIGLEQAPDQFIAGLVEVFRAVRDVLADDGTLWVNIGDSYAREPSKGGSGPGGKNIAYSDSYGAAQRVLSESRGSSDGVVGRAARPALRVRPEGIAPKNLLGIPWMLAFALRADGWYLRQEIIWHKPNPMPESVTDRCTKSHEQLFLLSKSPRYFFDHEAIKEDAVSTARGNSHSFARETATTPPPGKPAQHRAGRAAVDHVGQRNRRSVWSINTSPYKGAHFATFPPDLIVPCILAGSRPGDIVLDPFGGSGTTAGVALAHGRRAILCELNEESILLIPDRVASIRAAIGAPKPKKKKATKMKKRQAIEPQSDLFGGEALS